MSTPTVPSKRRREIEALVTELGFEVVEIGVNGGCHIKVTCKHEGKQFRVSASLTPSCPFWHHKFQRDLKRARREA